MKPTITPQAPQVPAMTADELLLALVDELSGIRVALVSLAQLYTLTDEERQALRVTEDGDIVQARGSAPAPAAGLTD